ncbi:MAG: flagellar basal body P-ring formation protein FlgA [Burkholderia sp.]|jgi:flagella basal body P-ring formation protein FlgA|uniref:flagellar basal body P-ring formation chaperone FlgA n=1 Tax=Burkholderia sp. TaxID=36773 RepID=UPI0025903E01|nr:flagellar basal body P-ring formation chaperone FlgA [Burkholderia sp.]MCA3779289.1 flagellar basal body P-ring formation protein FlgA [Burkholderia sp.]MCA3789501.1 flagellar basal body P-ring formation protein FlgA [Burkholderia sp.]MCA3796315.1 flagellar basal body P-ring formation protein FlgA [Burkholderia sp.]MCA3802629.1 flagellar basal body P-ring formation protein FlgA [Burkholderia sp.]MCA3810169.1 flagellar basal body P-ring formation protein FlgA [Burkholderia sp.]
MTGSALRDRNGRLTHVRRAFVLAAALWIAAPAVHADDGMIVIPGRGETAEAALAHANSASGGQFGGNAGMASGAGIAPEAGRAAPGAGAAAGMAAAGYAAQPVGAMVVTTVPPPAPAPAPAYAAARTNAGYRAQPRAVDPAAIATVVAGTAEPASNPVRPAPPSAAAARLAAARTASAALAPRTAAVSANPAPAASAAQPATPPGQQDPETIRRAALTFLQQQIAGLPGKTTATVTTAFPRGLAACTTLEPFLPTGARLWGRTTVGVRCAGERPWTVYLQAKVTVQATYYVAARQIAPGEPLSAADLMARDGDLTVMPLAVITDPAQAIGSTALARISAGLPLRQDMLKSAASVSAGQTVRVVAAGPGFTISAEGSVLANAAPGQSVRVRMAAGQIVTAIVKDAGTVEIPL